MADVMRLKEVDSPVCVQASRLHNHNVGQPDRNSNQPTGNTLPDSTLLHTTQWPTNYKSSHVSNGTNFNNNLATLQQRHPSTFSVSSDFLSESSPDDSIGEYEEAAQSSSSLDVSPQGDEYRCFSRGDLSDSDSLSEDGNTCPHPTRGIVNPNYPGFQHLAHQLDSSSDEDDSCNNNNNNNNSDEDTNSKINSINHLDSIENFQKTFYDKPKFNIPLDTSSDYNSLESSGLVVSNSKKDLNIEIDSAKVLLDKEDEEVCGIFSAGVILPSDEFVKEKCLPLIIDSVNIVDEPSPYLEVNKFEPLVVDMAALTMSSEKMVDAFLSGAKEELLDSNRAQEDWECQEKFNKEEKDKEDVVPRKKEKMEINYNVKKKDEVDSGGVVRRRETGARSRDSLANRRSVPAAREKKRASPDILGSFDVYNIETAMPKIDLDAIESHLRAAREEERRRRNDREEIRRRLAMGSDADEYYNGDKPGRKPSLQARLQSGMNLQICFMNETASDVESPGSDSESSSSPAKHDSEKSSVPRSLTLPIKPLPPAGSARPSTSLLSLPLRKETDPSAPQQAQSLPPMTEADFFARQARLQAEARMALAQAKEMAHMQMEVERQRQKKSPITEMVRSSLEKVGIPFPEDRRRVSRQLLTEMNVAQLQVIVNDLHTQIEILNESLVKFLMDRDDLHMEQDSMLVDIEDLTRYLGAKEQSVKEQKGVQLINQNNNHLISVKPKIKRITNLVKK